MQRRNRKPTNLRSGPASVLVDVPLTAQGSKERALRSKAFKSWSVSTTLFQSTLFTYFCDKMEAEDVPTDGNGSVNPSSPKILERKSHIEAGTKMQVNTSEPNGSGKTSHGLNALDSNFSGENRGNPSEKVEEDEDYVEYIPVKKRRMMEAQKIMQRKGKGSLSEDAERAKEAESKPSLLVKASQLKKDLPEISPMEQLVQQEKDMIERLSDRKTLMSVRELAKGIQYHEPMVTGWKPPTAVRYMSENECEAIRKQWHILVEGGGVYADNSRRRTLRIGNLPVPRAR